MWWVQFIAGSIFGAFVVIFLYAMFTIAAEDRKKKKGD